jgi:hypothetical protein
MKIETKFNAGEEVFYKEDGEIKHNKIRHINITIVDLFKGVKNFVEIEYFVKTDSYEVKRLLEDELFRTKSELIGYYSKLK